MVDRQAVQADGPGEGLTEAAAPTAPLALLTAWVDAAVARGGERGDGPGAVSMALATVDASGAPNVRPVMLRFLTADGPAFVTDLGSTKAAELAANPAAALTLAWPAMFRSIRFRGRVRDVEPDLIADYFRSRPWQARIAAWASAQSEPIADRSALESAYAAAAARWPDTGSPGDVPLPARWGGYRLIPDEVEFWAGRASGLHDRIAYSRAGAGTMADPGAWRRHRRQP
ncbi:MAG: pyridoxal 5'-phosphate synthase [Tetrasphaera sp.]